LLPPVQAWSDIFGATAGYCEAFAHRDRDELRFIDMTIPSSACGDLSLT
jgi:hypothetical protein